MSKAFLQVGIKVPIEGIIRLLLTPMMIPQPPRKVKKNFPSGKKRPRTNARSFRSIINAVGRRESGSQPVYFRLVLVDTFKLDTAKKNERHAAAEDHSADKTHYLFHDRPPFRRLRGRWM